MRACAQAFVELAKQRGVTVVLVGHVTKDGSLAGPRTLEHLVDTVLSFEGDRHHALRFLRATKHRFGATHELGVFEMGESGLSVVDDAAGLFLADRRPEVSGSAVVPVLEGSRPLLVELQALAAPVANPTGSPHRSVQGVDRSRVDVVLAVLQQHVGIAVHQADVFVSVVGGVRLVEPGVDLGLALAIASAMSGEPLPPDLVARRRGRPRWRGAAGAPHRPAPRRGRPAGVRACHRAPPGARGPGGHRPHPRRLGGRGGRRHRSVTRRSPVGFRRGCPA